MNWIPVDGKNFPPEYHNDNSRQKSVACLLKTSTGGVMFGHHYKSLEGARGRARIEPFWMAEDLWRRNDTITHFCVVTDENGKTISDHGK